MTDRNTRIRASQLLDGSIKLVDLDDAAKVVTASFIIDGGGSEISTGIAGEIKLNFNGTITGVTLLADQTGSIVVDINKGTFSAFPTLASITASATPTLSSAQKDEDTTLSGWTISVSDGDVLQYEVDSITTITRCTVILDFIKTA